jgi:two-component system response regulator NreC
MGTPASQPAHKLPMTLTILICDDHNLIREGVAALLERQNGWQVVAQTADGDEAVRRAVELAPDVAILDVAMPGTNGVDTAARIHSACPSTGIVALSAYGDPYYQRRMFDAGAGAYVLKDDASQGLVNAVQAVLRGKTYRSPSLSRRPRTQSRYAPLDLERLTPRELEVFRHLAQGQRSVQVAETLGISVKTVDTHRARIMLKLRAENLADLVKMAIRGGVISLD